MADEPMNGGGSDDSDGGNPPKRPRIDEPAPRAGPSNEQPSAGSSRQGVADFQRPVPPRRQREQDRPAPGPSVFVVKTKADLQKWIEATWPMVWAQMPQPGPLVDPYYWTRVPRETLRHIEQHHHARLVNFWERIIRHYRGIQPMEVTNLVRNGDAQEEQVAPQLPPEQVNVPDAGPQAAGNANGQAVVAGPGEQAVPEVDVEDDGDGDDAEAEARM